jgi:hypothetical protein
MIHSNEMNTVRFMAILRDAAISFLLFYYASKDSIQGLSAMDGAILKKNHCIMSRYVLMDIGKINKHSLSPLCLTICGLFNFVLSMSFEV